MIDSRTPSRHEMALADRRDIRPIVLEIEVHQELEVYQAETVEVPTALRAV